MSPGFLGTCSLAVRLAASAICPGVAKRQHFCRNCVALIILNRQEVGLQEIVEGGT